jgi:hypothetical protein
MPRTMTNPPIPALAWASTRCSFQGLAGARDRVERWSRLFLEFLFTQGFMQVAGMLSGLIYVRFMPFDQYGLYALSLGALSFVAIGSDLGLTSSLDYFWRQCSQSGSAIEPKIAAVRRLRSIFLGLAVIVCAALLYKFVTSQSLAAVSALGCFVLIVATAWSQSRTTVEIQLMRLRGQQRQSYYCEIAGSLARLLAAGSMIMLGLTRAWFGLAGGLLGSFTVLAVTRMMTGAPSRASQTIDRETWRDVAGYFVPIVPVTAVYMVQEPLILWLAATYGGQAPVAEVFAVGRAAAVFTLLGSFIIVVVSPRLASIRDDAHFALMAASVLSGLGLLCLSVVIMAYLQPSLPLLLIGSNYAHLDKEVVIAITTSSFTVLIMFVAIANRLRGWVRLEPVVAMCQVVAILGVTFSWSFHTALNVLLASMVLSGVSLACFLTTSIIGLLWPNLIKTRYIPASKTPSDSSH